jgi:CRISPR-associated protein (TIGR02584 family)
MKRKAQTQSSIQARPNATGRAHKQRASKPQKPEIVLLAVVGMSPAVLTETIWALAQEAEPVLPSRIIAITTTGGREQIRRSLFEPLPRFNGQTAWQALRAVLEKRGMNLQDRLRFGITPDDIRVITAADRASGQSVELADIRTPAHNETAADSSSNRCAPSWRIRTRL